MRQFIALAGLKVPEKRCADVEFGDLVVVGDFDSFCGRLVDEGLAQNVGRLA